MARVFNISVRKFCSALYITGDKAQNNFAVLTPFINFENFQNRKSELIKSIVARRLPIDFDKIEKRWDFFKMIADHKTVLEATRTEIQKLIANLKTENLETNQQEIEKLLLHLKIVKDDLKNVKDYYYGIDEDAHLAVLNLPNFLHKLTPIDCEKNIYNFLDKPKEIDKSHMEIANIKNLIDYTNPVFCFLKSEAALFEFSLTNFLHEKLQNIKFVPFSNADFARSVITEGCGIGYLDNYKIFTLYTQSDLNKLHLVGGGSLYSFMAYFARNLIQKSILPIKLFSIGRQYKPLEVRSDLFNLSQNTVARVFMGLEDDSEKIDLVFESVTQDIIKIYESLGYHFRVIYVKASNLEKGESLKVSFEMFSNHLGKYIEVGYLSLFDNYLSNRLLFMYNENKERKFVNVISGEVLNVQKVLGCLIENNYSSEKPLICNVLQNFL